MDAGAAAHGAVRRMLAGLVPNTTLTLTVDHCGHDETHGSNAAVDLTIPWTVVGPRIPAGRANQARVSTMDTTATTAHVLGLTLSPTATGRPVLEAFAATSTSTPLAALAVR